MYANYHAHTFRCHHASGTEREYIEKAICGGFRIFGFSDHTPMPFEGGYESGFRVFYRDIDDYFKTLSDLKKEYEKDIEIHIGLESEYYPALFAKQLETLKDYPLEYLICGQHFTRNETDGNYSGEETQNPAVLRDYVDQLCEGMHLSAFTYLAHPDLLHYTPDDEVYHTEMTRLCKAAKETGTPLEINFLGIGGRRHYPSERFLRICSEVGNRMIFGLDAHCTDCAYQPQTEKTALALAEKYSLTVLPEVKLRNPFVF